jgi:hypothetical protein
MKSLFRSLIIISNLAYLIWFFQPYYSIVLYTDDIRQLLRSDGYGGNDFFLQFSVELGWVLLLFYLVTAVGLYFYVKLARMLFTLLVAISLFLPFMYGVSVQSHIDVFMNTITTLCDGIVLYMCYLSSIAENFEASNEHVA